MADCKTCKRTDVKCCPTCGRGNDCDVYHKCGEDCIGFKPMTQGDKIRSMTDEELAELLDGALEIIDCSICDEPQNEFGSCMGDCKNEYLKWLKSEVGCE